MLNSSDEIQTDTLIKLPAFSYSSRSRALLFVLALLFATVSARAQTEIRSLTNVIEGHAVGGVTTDLLGNTMSPTLANSSGRSRPRASGKYLRQAFMARRATQSTMKATSYSRISTAIQSLRSIEKVKRSHLLLAV
jgi:hypothetical protein